MSTEGVERRFVRFSPESVRHCAENVGIQVSPEVSNALVEDVSFRIRQITDIASQFMRHSKRRRLCVDDFDKALKWSGIEPLYGHHTPDVPILTHVPQTNLFSVHDPEVTLEDIAIATPVTEHMLPEPPSVKATWLSVEGVAIGNVDAGDVSQDHVTITRAPNEAREKYLSLLLETIVGENEDLRRLALSDVQSNASIANIIPEMAQYLQETLERWSQFTPVQLLKLLKLVSSLFRNQLVFLEPYVQCVYPHLKSVVHDSAYLTSGGEFDHWHVRQLAAATMALVLQRCGTPHNDYSRDLYSSFGYQFSLLTQQNSPSLPVIFSILATLRHLGGESIVEVLLPHIEPLNRHLQGLVKSSNPSMKDDAMRVTDVLLDVAHLLLISGVKVKSEQLPALTSPGTSSQLRPGQQTAAPATTDSTGFLLANTSFGLGSVKSDLGTGDANLTDVVGGGGAESTEEEPTLYGFLFDLFGESLCLRLAGCESVSASPPPPPVSQGGDPSPQLAAPTSKDVNSVNRFVTQFLSREGFKPIKIDLPYYLPQPRRSYGGRSQWSFSVPRFVLPVQSNALERGMRMGHSQQHGGRVQTRPCPSYKRRSHKLRPSTDIRSVWI